VGGDFDSFCFSRIDNTCSRLLQTIHLDSAGVPAAISLHSYLEPDEFIYAPLAVIDEYLFALVIIRNDAADTTVLRMFDTTDPDHPGQVDDYMLGENLEPRFGRSLLVDGEMFFIIHSSELLIFRLLRQPVVGAIGPGGGIFSSAQDGVSYLFGADAFTATVTLTHTPRALSSQVAISGALFSTGYAFQLALADEQGRQIQRPLAPFSLIIDYPIHGLGPIAVAKAGVYRYEAGQWTPRPSLVNPLEQTIIAVLTRDGIYAILGERNPLYLPAITR
jgi:hypothetical protein